MTEVTFSKQFLASLEARPIKLSSDYVADARQLPPQSAYILPRNSKPYTKRPATSTTAADSSQTQTPPSADITLKTVRATSSTPTSLVLASQPLQNSIFDLKKLVARRSGFAVDKIKVLWEKRPVPDSKTIGEVVGVGVERSGVEMGVMFVGAPTAAPIPAEADDEVRPVPNADAAALDAAAGKDTGVAGGAGADSEMRDAGDSSVAQGKSGWDVCETDEFWDDLGSFVMQRVRDESVAKELVAGFRKTWRGSR